MKESGPVESVPNPPCHASSCSHPQSLGSARWSFHTPHARGLEFQVVKMTGDHGARSASIGNNFGILPAPARLRCARWVPMVADNSGTVNFTQ